MKKRGGWRGKVLEVDLSRRKIASQDADPGKQEDFLGGRGLNVSTLYENLPQTDPFDAGNVLVFGAGPLVGTIIPANGRYNVSSRSPLTGLLGDANAAGLWAPLLKKIGYDGIVVRGAADRPVYLYVTGNQVEIREAGHLWGRTTSETYSQMKRELGLNAYILTIGPAGENLVRFASILNDGDRAAGRTGNGAVMGSKKLKAIVLAGRGQVPVADPDRVSAMARKIKAAMEAAPSFKIRSQLGTTLCTLLYNTMGVLPARNHQSGIFPGAEAISGERLKERYVIRPKSCYCCPIHCSRFSEIKQGRFAGTRMEGPEFETICAMGSNLGNDDLEAILYLNRRLNDLGLDSISTGGCIAYAMECFENGLIHRADADGLELSWGNVPAILSLVENIAARRGLGDLLAEGVLRASRKIKGSDRYAMHVKGMEVPAQEVRGLKGWGLGWAVASRGGDHCRAFPVMETVWPPEQALAYFGTEKAADRFADEGKAAMVKWAEDLGAVIDAVGLCKIAYVSMAISPDLIPAAFEAVTGKEMTLAQMLHAGERINNLERLLNLKLGLSPAQDTLPRRLVEEPLPEGPSRGQVIPIEKMVQDYYRVRKWDPLTGYPQAEKLRELSLPLAAD